MKKNLILLLAAVLMMTSVRAQVVQVGTAEALSNAFLTATSGSTIRLTGDIAMYSTLWLGTETMGTTSSDSSRLLTLDLYGHTLTRADGTYRLLDLTHGELTIMSSVEGGQIQDQASGSSIEDLIYVTGSTLKDVNPMATTEGLYSRLTVSAGVTITAQKNAITIDRVGAANGHNIQYGTDVYRRGSTSAQYSSVANGVRLEICGEIHAEKYCVKSNGFLMAPTTDGTTLRTKNTSTQYANYTDYVVQATDVDYVPYIYICSSAELTTSDTTTGSTALYASGYANWYIYEGASCSGSIGLYIKSGELRVSGANIASTNPTYYSANSPYYSGVSAGGSAVVIESGLTESGPVSLSIDGGSTISAESGYAIEEIVSADSTTNVTELGIADCILKGGDAGIILLSDATMNTPFFSLDEETVTMIAKQTTPACLDNINWQYSEDSTLYITDDGAICDYSVEVDQVRAPWAYLGPDVMRIELSEGITHIGDIAFLDCQYLVAITCHAVTPPTLGDAVFSTTESVSSSTLYVPAESVAAYQADSAWSSYFNIIQAIRTEEEIESVQSIASATGDAIRWIGTTETLTADKTLAYLEITEEQGQTLTIAGGAKLTIGQCVLGAYAEVVVNPGGALIINDSIITDEESNIVLKSDINQTGMFVMGPEMTNNRQPNALVQLSPDIYTSADGTYHWQTFAIPVTQVESVTKNPNSSTYVSLWDAANATWVMMSNWSELLPFHAAKITNMVAESSTDRVTYSFMGNLLGNVTDDLIWQNTGWNLLGNSFTAPMSTVSLLNDLAGQDAEATVWLIDPNDGSYKAVNAAMSAFAIPTNRLTISAMSGFVLNNTGTGEGAITIDYANTVYNYALNPTDAQYSLPSNQDNTITAKAKITISCSSGEQDELYLLEGSNYSSQYESGADISKLMNQGINLYATSGNDNLYMVATNDLTNTPLTFRSNASETAYTMTFSDVAGTVILYDAVTGSEILLANGGTYDFMCAADMMVSDRFYINQVYTAPMICHRNGTLQVSGSNGLTVRVRDQDGSATVIGDVYITSNYQEIDLSALSEGVYKVEWNSQIFNIYVEGWSPSVYTYIPEGGCTKSDDTNIAVTLLEGNDFLFGCTYLSGLTVGAHVYRDSLSNICGSDSVIVLTMMVYANLTPSGTCGDSLTWVFNTIDSTLTLTGSGAMTNFSDESLVPWVEYKADIVTLILPEALTTIGSFAFAYCTGLTEVTIPNSVTTIGRDAFNNCSSLTSVTIPNNVTILDDYTFADCTGLTEVTIGNSVTSIRDGVFQYCSSLTSVTIPNSVTSMGEGVFDHCSGLTSITCEAVTPPTLGSNVFYNVSTSIPLYVPGSSIALYQAAEQWSDFTNIHAICDTVYEFSETIYLCGADSFIWHDKVYTTSGIYIDTLQSVEGCDSICTLLLRVYPSYAFYDEWEICEGEPLQWHGRTLKKSGIYTDSLLTVTGCDSIYTLRLTVNPTYLIEDIVSVREDKLPYMWQGEAINQSGDYRKEYTATTGCDSVHTLHFTVTALPIYTVNVLADHGHVNGTGTYPEGTRITLTAVPDEGFEFQMWSDGTTTNPKNFTVLQDTTFRALFYMPEVEQEVTVDSIETNSVTITWDTVPGAVLYELRIYKNGELVVTYEVDPDNNIVGEIFNGPDRLIARKDSTGGSSETLQVSVGGLESGQDYTYSLDALDDDRSFVGAQSGSFTTEEEPIDGLDTLFDKRHPAEPRKILRDGLLFIELPDGRLYTPIGDELQ